MVLALYVEDSGFVRIVPENEATRDNNAIKSLHPLVIIRHL